MHGFEPQFPIDNKILPNNLPYDINKSLETLLKIREKIPKIIQNAQVIQKKYHDEKHRFISFNKSNLVLIKFPFLKKENPTN